MRYSLNRIYVLVESAIMNLISIIEIRASILSRRPKGGVKTKIIFDLCCHSYSDSQ